MNYLFLDITCLLTPGRYSDCLEANELFNTDAESCLLDAKSLYHLECIIEATDAKIIITSTTRHDWDNQALSLNDYLLTDAVIGITPTILAEKGVGKIKIWYNHKGMEVEEWLSNNASEPYKYAIIDYDDDYLETQSGHLVLADPMAGITKETADKVISLLE